MRTNVEGETHLENNWVFEDQRNKRAVTTQKADQHRKI